MIKIIANLLKNTWHALSMSLVLNVSFFSNGLYNSARTTAPNPPSNKEIKLRNCVIEDTSPLISDPNVLIIKRGSISPCKIAIVCSINALIKFLRLFIDDTTF